MLMGIMVAKPAPRTVVFSFTTVGVDEKDGRVATGVFRTELMATGRFQVIDADVVRTTLGNDEPVEGITAAVEQAQRLGAEKAVIGSLSRLGGQILAEVKLVDVTTASLEFHDRLGTTSGSDLDVILSRLARGVAERKKAEQTAEIGRITQRETEEPARRSSFWAAGGRFGYFFPIGGFGSNPNPPLGVSGCGLYETPGFMAEAAYDFYGLSFEDRYAGLWRAGFSGFALMNKTDICPYWGGGVGIGTVTVMNDEAGSGIGPIINLGGGVMFLRTYDFRLVADLRYYLAFCKVRQFHPEQTISTFQHGPAISVGLMYKRSKTDTGRGGCCGGGIFGF